MKRFGQMIRLKPSGAKEYILHSAVWPGVLEMISKCNITNYSIYLKDDYLFSYFEYIGDNFDTDMNKMAADSTTQQWWASCKTIDGSPGIKAIGRVLGKYGRNIPSGLIQLKIRNYD